MSPLNYFYNTWGSTEIDLILVNDDLANYDHHLISGSLGDDVVLMAFTDTNFTLYNEDDKGILLQGTHTFVGLTILLEPLDNDTNYPDCITLNFEEIA
jgi:hypothetical protein